MSECSEVASSMPPMWRGATFSECVTRAKAYMPGESMQVIDNVAWAMFQAVKPSVLVKDHAKMR